MPAPRPPRLGFNPSPTELKKASQQIARANRLTVTPPLTMAQSANGFNIGVDTSRDFFLARLTNVYTVTGGAQADLNLYSFIEQLFDPSTGFPLDYEAGRQTYPALTGTPTSAYAIEVNNTLLTVPGSTPLGYSDAGPYVEMRLKGVVDGVPVYEFEYTPTLLTYLTTSASTFSLSTSWTNITGLYVSLAAGTTWQLTAQLQGSISSSSSGAGDSLSFRFYDGTSVYGEPIECCNAVCASLSYVDAASLVAVVINSGVTSLVVYVQGIINTSSGSTGSLLGGGSTYGNQLVAIRLA